jgi:hypothetical protein
LTGGAPSRRSSSGEERKEEPLCGSGEAHPRAGDRHQGRVQGSQRRGLEGYFVDASRPPMNLGIWGFRRGRRRGRIWGCRRGRRRGGFGVPRGGGVGVVQFGRGTVCGSVVRIGCWAWLVTGTGLVVRLVGWVVRE